MESRWRPGFNIYCWPDRVSFYHRLLLGYRSIWPQAALYCWIAWHGAVSTYAHRDSHGRPFPRHPRSGADIGISGFLRILHWACILDARSGDISERCAWDGNDGACADSMGGQCCRRASVSLCVHVIGKTFTFSFLAAMALGQGIFAWLCVPETKNKRLEEIEEYWTNPRQTEAGKPV